MEQWNVETTPDLGVVLYEKSNAKSMYDAPTGKIGAKGWAQRIYMLLLAAGLIAWFLYSVITQIFDPEIGAANAIIEHVGAFAALIAAEIILILTAFQMWGKFARAALKNRALTRQHRMEGYRTDQLANEIYKADANKGHEDAIRIYRDYVVVANGGEETVLSKSDLQSVQCKPLTQGYQLTFVKYDGGELVANALLPFADLPLIKKHFDRFDYTEAQRGNGYLKKKFPLLAFMLVPILIGVALICVHHFVLPQMPIVFGIVFLALGVLLTIMQFNDIAIIKHGISPIGGGIILMGLPVAVVVTLVDLVEEITYAAVWTSFTEVHAVLALFFGFGPMLIIAGIAGIINCAKL